jgi:hypothetical protein
MRHPVVNEPATYDQYCHGEHHKECMAQAPPVGQRLFELSQPLNHAASREPAPPRPQKPGLEP